MTTVNRMIPSSQPNFQLSQYVMLLQWCMIQQGNDDLPEVNADIRLKHEKQMSRQSSQG